MKQPTTASKTPLRQESEPKLKTGLPGTPDEQRRDLRAAMERHAETLRRLGR